MTDGKMLIIRSGTLEIELVPYDPDKRISEYIRCDMIDRSSAIDYLEQRNIDVWVDDCGLIENKPPVFLFAENKTHVTGMLVGDIGLLTHDMEGESHGLTDQEVDDALSWIMSHYCVKLPYDGDEITAIVIDKEESAEHLKRIRDMKEWVRSQGGFVIEAE